MNAQVP
ncbi:hypothetical protein Zm00014a_035942 [Zea mays]|nr:hypothetical protein Zm00014a_035942 [Zea mays]